MCAMYCETGTWRLVGYRLLLFRNQDSRESNTINAGECFMPVLWERRIYLVDEYRMPAFCAEAARKSWYERDTGDSHTTYLKFPSNKPRAYTINDAYKPLSRGSRPRLPERYRTFYEEGPIRARIVRRLPSIAGQGTIPSNAVRVLLDRGTRARVRTGLILETRHSGWANLITEASPDTAVAVQVPFPAPFKGWPVRVKDEFGSGEGDLLWFGTGLPWPRWARDLRETWDDG